MTQSVKITVLLTSEADAAPYEDECLWGIERAPNQYEVANVPFLAYNIALGDIVQADPDSNGRLVVTKIISRSGNETLRALAHDDVPPATLSEITREARSRGAFVERWAGKPLFAFSFPSWPETAEFVEWVRASFPDHQVDFESGVREGLPFWDPT